MHTRTPLYVPLEGGDLLHEAGDAAPGVGAELWPAAWGSCFAGSATFIAIGAAAGPRGLPLCALEPSRSASAQALAGGRGGLV